MESVNANFAQKIEKFLDLVVLSGNDTMQAKRKQFYDTYLLPPGGVLPSQAILNKIEQMINGEK